MVPAAGWAGAEAAGVYGDRTGTGKEALPHQPFARWACLRGVRSREVVGSRGSPTFAPAEPSSLGNSLTEPYFHISPRRVVPPESCVRSTGKQDLRDQRPVGSRIALGRRIRNLDHRAGESKVLFIAWPGRSYHVKQLAEHGAARSCCRRPPWRKYDCGRNSSGSISASSSSRECLADSPHPPPTGRACPSRYNTPVVNLEGHGDGPVVREAVGRLDRLAIDFGDRLSDPEVVTRHGAGPATTGGEAAGRSGRGRSPCPREACRFSSVLAVLITRTIDVVIVIDPACRACGRFCHQRRSTSSGPGCAGPPSCC